MSSDLSTHEGRDLLRVGIAQISPCWMDRQGTLAKLAEWVVKAADQGCDLVAFGEALVPGYPFWLERSDAARFESELQKEWHALYLEQAVCPERGDFDELCALAGARGVAICFGSVEAAADRGGHSLYCTLMHIDARGQLVNRHRKLVPTYEERLCWAPGDGHGLQVQRMGAFRVGGLNCWENWMPLARAALHAQGEDLHLAVWPGAERNTREITRFLAREGRSFVLSVSGLLRPEELPTHLPGRELLLSEGATAFANGGSCVAGPDGRWMVEPVCDREALIVVELDHALVRRERQNFDPAGHYSRPDVTRLIVDRRRQATVEWLDE